MERVFALLFLCFATVIASGKAPWSYHGILPPAKWYQKYPLCGGKSQSPIDIKRAYYLSIKPFRFYNYNLWNQAKLSNNGHTVQVTLSPKGQHIRGGGLDDAYNAAQFHFHWGSDLSRGSEHLLHGRAAPMEMHIVHFKAEYKTIANAITKKDGLAVLGVFFKVGAFNPDLHHILSNFHKIRRAGMSTSIVAPHLIRLLPRNKNVFYRYQGSLTTPGCNQAVVWTLFKEFVTLSPSQLKMFRHLTKHLYTPLVNNYRPVQPLNGRKVYHLTASSGYTPWDF